MGSVAYLLFLIDRRWFRWNLLPNHFRSVILALQLAEPEPSLPLASSSRGCVRTRAKSASPGRRSPSRSRAVTSFKLQYDWSTSFRDWGFLREAGRFIYRAVRHTNFNCFTSIRPIATLSCICCTSWMNTNVAIFIFSHLGSIYVPLRFFLKFCFTKELITATIATAAITRVLSVHPSPQSTL